MDHNHHSAHCDHIYHQNHNHCSTHCDHKITKITVITITVNKKWPPYQLYKLSPTRYTFLSHSNRSGVSTGIKTWYISSTPYQSATTVSNTSLSDQLQAWIPYFSTRRGRNARQSLQHQTNVIWLFHLISTQTHSNKSSMRISIVIGDEISMRISKISI